MTTELLTPVTTPETAQMPPVLSVYDQLTTPEAQSAFGERVTEGRQLFDIVRATFDAEKEKSGIGILSLLRQEDELRKHWAFTDERETLWRNGGQGSSMLFDREDPAVTGLLEGLSGGGLRPPNSRLCKMAILCVWLTRVSQALLSRQEINHLSSL